MPPPALHPLVVGLGRSGAGLHLKVLPRLPAGPGVGCDPRPDAGQELRDVTVTRSLADAAALLTPGTTVVHVCTPPASRPGVLAELAEHGFTRLLVDKPLATDHAALDEILRLRRRHGLDIEVLTQWLAAGLTRELRLLVRERPLGALRSIGVVQHKPRLLRTLVTEAGSASHSTALDVEVPHALAVVLDLAGPARLVDARWYDMRRGDTVRPRMGGARLTLMHAGGVRTEIASDLTSPVQQRSVTLRFEHGTATGHYPLSEHDDHAHLVVESDAGRRVRIFRDDAFTAFLRRSYRRLATGRRADFEPCYAAARLLCEARERCLSAETAQATADPSASGAGAAAERVRDPRSAVTARIQETAGAAEMAEAAESSKIADLAEIPTAGVTETAETANPAKHTERHTERTKYVVYAEYAEHAARHAEDRKRAGRGRGDVASCEEGRHSAC